MCLIAGWRENAGAAFTSSVLRCCSGEGKKNKKQLKNNSNSIVNRCGCQYEAMGIYWGGRRPACRNQCQFNYCFAVTEIIHWNDCAAVRLASLPPCVVETVTLRPPIVGWTLSVRLRVPLLPRWVALNASVAEQPPPPYLIAQESAV